MLWFWFGKQFLFFLSLTPNCPPSAVPPPPVCSLFIFLFFSLCSFRWYKTCWASSHSLKKMQRERRIKNLFLKKAWLANTKITTAKGERILKVLGGNVGNGINSAFFGYYPRMESWKGEHRCLPGRAFQPQVDYPEPHFQSTLELRNGAAPEIPILAKLCQGSSWGTTNPLP